MALDRSSRDAEITVERIAAEVARVREAIEGLECSLAGTGAEASQPQRIAEEAVALASSVYQLKTRVGDWGTAAGRPDLADLAERITLIIRRCHLRGARV